MIRFTILWILALAPVAAFASERMAVLTIASTAPIASSYLDAMPDMIVSEVLRNDPEIILVERRQVEAAIRELQLDIGGLTDESGRRVGQWVGAERILVGTLSQVSETMRLDLRTVDVQSGRILQAGSAVVTPNHLAALIPSAVANLLQAPTQRQMRMDVKQQSTATGTGTGWLRVRFRSTLSLFTEKPLPVQKVRIYANGNLLGESATLDAPNQDYVLFDGPIPVGLAELRFEHGLLGKDGSWKMLFSEQPPSRTIHCDDGEKIELNYKLKVSAIGYSFTPP